MHLSDVWCCLSFTIDRRIAHKQNNKGTTLMLWEFGRSYSCSTFCYKLFGGNSGLSIFCPKHRCIKEANFMRTYNSWPFMHAILRSWGHKGCFAECLFTKMMSCLFDGSWMVMDTGNVLVNATCKESCFQNHFFIFTTRLIPQQTWCKSRLSEWFLFLADPQHVFWSLKDIIPSIVWGYGEEMLDNGSVLRCFFYSWVPS